MHQSRMSEQREASPRIPDDDVNVDEVRRLTLARQPQLIRHRNSG